MAEKAEAERVEIGFAGGQTLAARLAPNKLAELRKALASTDKLAREAAGWYDLATEDGEVSLDLRQVVFVHIGRAEHRIGFTGT